MPGARCEPIVGRLRALRFVPVAALVVAATGAVVAATNPAGLNLPAAVGASARRGASYRPEAICDTALAAAIGGRHADIDQIVLATVADSGDSVGTVAVAVRTEPTSSQWRCQVGEQVAMFGQAGVRALTDRRSGDDTTPGGLFALGQMTAWDGARFSMFGNRPDPGVAVPYRAVRRPDCWGATPGTARYGKLVSDTGCAGPDDEWLPRFGDVYSHAAVIGANLDPVSGDEPGEPAYASAIFLHRHSYAPDGSTPRPTSGCVSLAFDALVDTLRTIDPARNPHFAIGTAQWLRANA